MSDKVDDYLALVAAAETAHWVRATALNQRSEALWLELSDEERRRADLARGRKP